MPSKTILCVTGVDQSDEDVNTAIAVCEEMHAHLSLLVAAFAAPPPVGAYAMTVSDGWAAQRNDEVRKLRERGEHLEKLLQRRNIPADVTLEYREQSQIGHAIGTRARYADLALVGPDLLKDGDLKGYTVEGALFESARPVLLLPHDNPRALRPKTVLVAWDASLEAARAVASGLDIIARAGAVHVVIVDPEPAPGLGEGEPGTDVAAWLARHGARVTIDQMASAGKTTSEAIAQRAIDIAADMIVMGAYAHSRLRERIFGGVTRDFVKKPPNTILLAH